MGRGKITERVDAITGISEQRRVPAPPCPKSVKIELTARGNFKCSFCATAEKLRVKGDMDWDFHLKLLKELRRAGVEEIGVFYLGESFILDWLPDAIRAARDEGFPYVFITTNGSLADPGKVRACMGDLKTQPFMEAWQAQKFQDLRAAHLTGDVRHTVCSACVSYG